MKIFRKAVLFIHGFSGELSDHEFLINKLELNKNYDCFSWTLPAHEKPILNKVKYEEWLEAVDIQIKFLIDNGYKKIYVIGHSMGGLLASYLAGRYPEIKKLVLIAPAYDYFSGSQFIRDIKSFSLKDKDTVYSKLFNKLLTVPASTMREFHKLVTLEKNNLSKVKCSILALHGDMDEVVPYKTLRYVNRKLKIKDKTITTVSGARHVILRGKRKEDVIDYIEKFLRGGRKWKRAKKSQI